MNGAALKDERPHDPMQADEMTGEGWWVRYKWTDELCDRRGRSSSWGGGLSRSSSAWVGRWYEAAGGRELWLPLKASIR